MSTQTGRLNPALLEPERMRGVVRLRYDDQPLPDALMDLAQTSEVVDEDGELTPFGYDVAFAAFAYLTLLEDPENEVFEAVDLRGARVLDAGCGGGAFVVRALELGAAEAVGVDVGRNYLEFAEALAAARGQKAAHFLRDDLETMTGVQGSFDVVISRLVIPLLDERRFLAQLDRVTRSGSRLFLKTHGWGFYLRDVANYTKARDPLRVARSVFGFVNGLVLATTGRRMSFTFRGVRQKDAFHTRGFLRRALQRQGWRLDYDSWGDNRISPYLVATKN